MHGHCNVLRQSLEGRRAWDVFVLPSEQGAEMLERMVQAEEGVFDTGREGELATSCVSCCNYTVKATRVVLMLFSETFYLSVSS